MRIVVRGDRHVVRYATPQEARSLVDVMKILDERKESILLSPNYHIYELDASGNLVKLTDAQREAYKNDSSKWTIVPGDRLYGIQDASGNWYYPSTSGFTVGWGRTQDERMGDDNQVYFKGYFPDYMVRDGEKMKVVREIMEGGQTEKIVEVNMRIDPDDVDPFLFKRWVQRLSKNKMGYDEETGTYIGPPVL